ncbi:hypothetical protein HanHA89_Chr02g0077851 [Helianthus annuus]|nr:hypothetical protein HanHA89_Chr17g0689321 [Helianthus annuus]KAJ0620029.1 hypothetical protein HanHA89_Chr02g0077851 [Helianthus annuus]
MAMSRASSCFAHPYRFFTVVAYAGFGAPPIRHPKGHLQILNRSRLVTLRPL